jgi:glycine/D-amino acid oxidase-like deaminating enzyme
MTRRYSALSLFKEGLAGQTGWEPAWRSPAPKPRHDVLLIGGGHGLATAYYLEKNHGVTNVVRSNYFYPESAAIYGLAHLLYKGLSTDLNCNIMLSQRGVLTLARSEAGLETAARSVNAIQVNGIDTELLVSGKLDGWNTASGLSGPGVGALASRKGRPGRCASRATGCLPCQAHPFRSRPAGMAKASP